MPTEQLLVQLQADISQFRAEMRQAQGVAQQSAQNMERNFQGINRSTQLLANSVRLLGPLFAAIGFGKLATDSLQAAKQLASLNRAFATITGSAQGAREELAFVRREADRLGIDFVGAAQSFQGLAAAARDTRLEGQGAREVFTAVAQASATLGLSADQTSGALTALQQIMSKGVVSAEELRGQLGERIPGAFQIAARAVGVTTQELGKMLEAGSLLAEDFLPKFARQLSQELPGDVDATTQATAQLRNAWTELLATFGTFVRESAVVQDALKAATGLIQGLTGALKPTGDELDTVAERIAQVTSRLKELQAQASRAAPNAIAGFFPEGSLARPSLGPEQQNLRREREELLQIFDDLAAQEMMLAEIAGNAAQDRQQFLQQEANAARRVKELRQRLEKDVTVSAEEQAKERERIAIEEFRRRERLQEQFVEDARNAERTLTQLREQEAERQLAVAEQLALDELNARESVEELKIDVARREADARIAEEQRVADEFARINRRTIREQERAAEDRARELERFTERVEDRLADVFQRALEGNLDLLDTLRDAFFATIAQMAARAASQAIILNIIPSLGLGGILPGGAGAPGGTQGGGGFLGGLLGSRIGGGTLGQGLGGAALGLGVGFTASSLLPQLGAPGGAGGGALAGLLGGGAGGFALAPLLGITGPFGALFGGLLGAGLGGLFGGLLGGGKKPQFLLEDLQLEINEALELIVVEATGNKRKISFETEQKIEEVIEGAVNELLGGVLNQARTLAPDIQMQLLDPLNELVQQFADALEGAEFDGKDLQEQFEQFVTQELPATFAEIFGEITADIRQAAVAASLQDEIQAQIDALQDAVRTPAELFERRLDQITALQGQLAGAGPGETTALAGQISQLVGQAFQLAGGQGVFGQDPLRLQQTQDELVQVLRDLQATIGTNLVPSFQGLQHPLTFTQPTVIQAHTGETLLPVGGNAAFNITINASPGMNPRDIADAVIREAERRGRFQQTTLATRRR